MTERILPDKAYLIPESADRVFEGEIFDVYQWQQQLFDGNYATYEMLKRPDTVYVVAVDDEGKVIVCDEEQAGGIFRKNHLPAGRVDPEDESVLAAAQRELLEETGWTYRDWKLLEVTQPEIKIEWFVYFFLAQNPVNQIEQNLDAGEKIYPKAISFEEAMKHSLPRHLLKFSSAKNPAELEAMAGDYN